MKVYAFVPAKGTSERIENKNGALEELIDVNTPEDLEFAKTFG